MVILVNKKANAIVLAEQAREKYPPDTNAVNDAGIFEGL